MGRAPVCGSHNRAVLCLVTLLMLLGAGCTSGAPDRVPVASPSADPGAATSADPTATATTPERDGDALSSEPSPTVAVRSGPSLDDDRLDDVMSLEAGEVVNDALNNAISVHRVRAFPAVEGQKLQLFEGLAGFVGGDSSLVMADIAMCGPGPFDDASNGSVTFTVADEVDAPLGPSTGVTIDHAIAEPAFFLPDPGSCARGWMPLPLDGAAEAAEELWVRYQIAAFIDGVVERRLIQWQVPVEPAGRPTPPESALALGEQARFRSGPLEGLTGSLEGWAEFVDEPVPDGLRSVGVRVQVCPAADGQWPRFGLGLDGWNLLEATVQSAIAPTTTACDERWVDFLVPPGAMPTSFFLSDGVDPVRGFVEWSLDGAAVDAER